MEALKSIIPIALGLGILLTWSMSKKYTIIIKFIVTVILLALFGVSWFVWPGRPFYTSTDNGATASLVTSNSGGNVIMTIAGSFVMSEELVPKLVKGYMVENDYEDIKINESGSTIEITGKLKGNQESVIVNASTNKDGLRNLEDDKIDIAISLLEAPENKDFEEKEIGLDAICVITSKDNNVPDLSLTDIASIFDGSYNKHYTVYCMEDNNEYREYFEKEVMQNKKISKDVKTFKDEEELIAALIKDPNGIGIIDYEFAKSPGIRLVAVKDSDNMSAVFPNDITLQNEDYALTMRVYMYSLIKTKNEHVQKFLNWIESDKGQDVVENSGFVNFDVKMVTKDADASEITARSDDPKEYINLINTATPISTDFRFEFGGYTLDSRAGDDISRVVNYIAKNKLKDRVITLAGFTDNVGDIKSNINLSIKRANTVRDTLVKQGLKNIRVVGFGPARPVRENISEEDKAENRRVELWINKK